MIASLPDLANNSLDMSTGPLTNGALSTSTPKEKTVTPLRGSTSPRAFSTSNPRPQRLNNSLSAPSSSSDSQVSPADSAKKRKL